MTYYFVSVDSSRFGDFQKLISGFAKSTLIDDHSKLEEILGSIPAEAFFFSSMDEESEEFQSRIALIKERAPHAKLIYLTEDKNAHDLKGHQLGPIGGDAYISWGTKAKELKDILESFGVPDLPKIGNKLEKNMRNEFSDFDGLEAMKNHPVSHQVDEIFKSVIKVKAKTPLWQSADALAKPKHDSDSGADMSSDDKELSLSESDELEISLGDGPSEETQPEDEGLELSLGDESGLELNDLGSEEAPSANGHYGDLSLESDEELSLSDVAEDELILSDDSPDAEELSLDDETEFDDEMSLEADEAEAEGIENLGELSFPDLEETPDLPSDDGLSLSDDLEEEVGLDLSGDLAGDLDLGGDLSLSEEAPLETSLEDKGLSLSLDSDDELSLSAEEADLSDDALEKLKEIDAIMDYDASQVALKNTLSPQTPEIEESNDALLDQPLVSDDLDLDSLNFSGDEVSQEVAVPVETKKSKKKEVKETRERNLGQDLEEISGAYSGEMERLQATISNLRTDRDELLAKLQKFEDEKVLQSRQTLTLRAELDEKKIELTIIRKKLNEELSEMKDRLKLFDEKRLILEEKNRLLTQELDKAAQKNKIDVKKIQMRERELEQRLELLKSDAETQIRNRDLKILELKRKIDAMEFDMESISQQEKRSVESRFELEDKLEKAIKTLRNAITVLEDETDRSNALSALKKNIDM